MNEITYDPNEKIDKWVFEESELRKAFRERKEYKEKSEYLQSKIDKAIEYIDKHFQDDEGIICKITGEYEAERNEKFIKDLLDILKEDK